MSDQHASSSNYQAVRKCRNSMKEATVTTVSQNCQLFQSTSHSETEVNLEQQPIANTSCDHHEDQYNHHHDDQHNNHDVNDIGGVDFMRDEIIASEVSSNPECQPLYDNADISVSTGITVLLYMIVLARTNRKQDVARHYICRQIELLLQPRT